MRGPKGRTQRGPWGIAEPMRQEGRGSGAMVIRYLVALVAAALIVGIGGVFCLQVRREFVATLRKSLDEVSEPAEHAAEREAARKALDAGEIPAGEWGFEVSDSLMRRIMIADMLLGLWPFWVVIVIGACLGGAWCAGWLGRSASRPLLPDAAVSSQLPAADQP